MKMAYETILVEKKDKTMILTLNRPEKLNAMNPQMLQEITQALAELRGDADTRFVILAGAGKSFSAGADMGIRGTTPPDAAQALSREQRLGQMAAHDMIRTYLNLEQVTIAAVHGYCLGAGLVFVIESDFIITAQDALLGVPETNVGVFYTWGSSARLSRLVGPLWAKQLIMTCENVTGEEAVQIGLANQAVPHDKLMDTAWELIDKIASKSPLATRLTKKLVNAYTATGQADLFVIEPELVERIHISGDPIEGGRAFREKRSPKFSDM
jgi:enoyl-CoA hydratase/carnithine racemase